MKKVYLVLGGLSLFLFSCIKHEVIPAPTPTVELDAHFIGEVSNILGTSTLELTEGVNGFSNSSEKVTILNPPPSFSEAVYYSQMSSSSSNTSIKIGLGSLFWDANVTSEPSVSDFNAFFNANLLPAYSDLAENGFEVVFKDGSGNIWRSQGDATNTNPQSVEFIRMIQESDASGDYALFTCEFDGYVYRSEVLQSVLDPLQDSIIYDSLMFSNAIYKGWFKR